MDFMKVKRFTLLLATLLFLIVSAVAQQSELEPSAARLQQHISYLASDALEGRRTGTPGANDAAHYVAGEFSRLGLRPGNSNENASRKPNVLGTRYLQTFPYVGSLDLGKGNTLSLRDENATSSFRVGEDWMPLGFSSNQMIENAQIMFAGYGITSSELNYNDYGGSYNKNV